jgi:protocatechuate 3,4-dioxygenase beta subunit
MSESENNRRQFLKNTSLAALALGLSTKSAHSESSAINNAAIVCDETTLDFYGEGPFYTTGPPTLVDGVLANSSEPGSRMIISGRVLNLDCSEYIPNAEIDIWHANDAGEYDNAGYNLRGKTFSNDLGFYVFETVKPGKYLNGSVFRPGHIHFKITASGHPTLTTQLYFEGDPDLGTDPASSITSGIYDARHRIISLAENAEGLLEGTWDIVISGDGTTVGVNDIHQDKGIIYNVRPNPFVDELTIRYGVYRAARVKLSVYDLQGRQLANLSEENMRPGQYDAVWRPDTEIVDGYYYVTLMINDLQVHYLKVIRKGSL